MKRLLSILVLMAAAIYTGICSADEIPAPTVNKGDTAWVIVATVLVAMMVIPGLALFYGGMVRAKNMLSILMQVFVIFALTSVLCRLWLQHCIYRG
jgi:Amt family ammonium transporter